MRANKMEELLKHYIKLGKEAEKLLDRSKDKPNRAQVRRMLNGGKDGGAYE